MSAGRFSYILALASLTLGGCAFQIGLPVKAVGQADASGKTVVVSLSKTKFNDAQQLKDLAQSAADEVLKSVSEQYPGAETYRLEESPTMTAADAYANSAISRAKFKAFLEGLATKLSAQDTVVIYTHSHGVQGGLVLNQYVSPTTGRLTPDVMPWSELGELILSLPAKNVIVFTMSCYSGGLVDYLNSVSDRWKSRNQRGQSLLVISAQNSNSLSRAVSVQDQTTGETVLMNGLPYAVSRTFARAGSELSLRELSDEVLRVSREAGSNSEYLNDSQRAESIEESNL